MGSSKLSVFLTVDAEIWPFEPFWTRGPSDDKRVDLTREFEHYVLGATDQGEFGIRFQMEMLNKHGLRACFFVEPLHAIASGKRWLSETLAMILAAGHDVQMHTHTEWPCAGIDRALAQHRCMHQYCFEDQVEILSIGRRLLQECGAPPPVAFRAGNFGANADTLRALRSTGAAIDSSVNHCYAGRTCMIEAPCQPAILEGVLEMPITVFHDYGKHLRPVQLAACSSFEMEHALWQARRAGWQAFVILWHGAELVRRRRTHKGPSLANRILVQRFQRLCHFLRAHRDHFETAVFSELDCDRFPSLPALAPLSSNPALTADRMLEQALARFF
jgi:hypothetical protein